MTDSELHPYVEWIVREARRPVTLDGEARARVVAAIRAEPLPVRRRTFWSRLAQPRPFDLSPIASLALAAGLVGIGVFTGLVINDRDGRSSVGQALAPVAVRPQLPVSDTVVSFVYVAPRAGRVFLVGDFNGWDASKTPLTRGENGAVWSVTVPLSVGRHVYAFVVDSRWTPDPHAPLAPDDGFGHANSVKLVGKGSAL
jgi:hypothetical protein